MTTIRLEISYDGAGFSGWAAQPGMRTVQGELEAGLAQILGEPVRLAVAGRTDAGVHAWRQVASFQTAVEVPADLARRLNGVGPDDLSLLEARPAAEGFDARRDARSRTYCYRVLRRDTPSPFERGRALWWPRQLGLGALGASRRLAPRQPRFHRLHPDQGRSRPLRARGAEGGVDRGARIDRLLLDRGRRLHAQHGQDPGRDHARGRLGAAERARVRVAARGQPPRACRGNGPAHGLYLASVAY